MKKLIYICLAFGITACNQRPQTTTSSPDSAENRPDTIVPNTEPALKEEVVKESKKDAALPAKTYSNKRFKEVAVEKLTEDTYSIQGKGQIFEANFGWVVEDGHNEIKTGHQTLMREPLNGVISNFLSR